ncbi:uncharacterized protein Ecym_2206 [Eremothecium cymbalariae DBVPG|uniref:Uncharacterized protein n=1 Tax=Eremothecium cymbalariae (strain CBS 270.75 / DBVPG 7215 / KCTC 17166 / NRRL Y-17582) TaxID=931890 RepID=G8JP50_ERECY|nr:Hypothetical protein Ecym_2206 [Eremothecium cymbalariae DBVPG\
MSQLEYSPLDVWGQQSPLDSLDSSPSMSSMSTTTLDVPSGVTATTVTRSSSFSEASYNNELSNQAIESIRRQQNQNKLIHLDPIPDFKGKNEIKPWLQKIFYPQGIEIVIERSDKIKVVFKCKASKRGKNGSSGVGSTNTAASSSSAGAGALVSPVGLEDGQLTPSHLSGSMSSMSPNTLSLQRKKKRAVSPYNTCPFRVRAAYSLKRKKWSIVVVNNGHSHPLKFNADSEEYKKFKSKLRENCDWEAVKRFDELEYRSKFNLPTEFVPIPCDCGLTQEIESFNVILPSTNILSAPASVIAEKKIPTVSKPKSRKLAQRNKKTLLHRGTTKSKLATAIQLSDRGSDVGSQHSLKQETTNYSLANYLFQDSSEIDFTEMFFKPLPHLKNHSGGGAAGGSGSGAAAKNRVRLVSAEQMARERAPPEPTPEAEATNAHDEQWKELESLLDQQTHLNLNDPDSFSTPVLPSQFYYESQQSSHSQGDEVEALVQTSLVSGGSATLNSVFQLHNNNHNNQNKNNNSKNNQNGNNNSMNNNNDNDSNNNDIKERYRSPGPSVSVEAARSVPDSFCTSATITAVDSLTFEMHALNAIDGLVKREFGVGDHDFSNSDNGIISPQLQSDTQPEVHDEMYLWEDQQKYFN